MSPGPESPTPTQNPPETSSFAPPRVIIAGFGLPGRSVADLLEIAHIPYTVIEVNAEVVNRCKRTGRHMVCGDVREEKILREAGIDSAEVVALMMPVDTSVLEAISVVHRIRPNVKIVARTMFTSSGMEAVKRGATDVLIAEQIVANEAARSVGAILGKGSEAPQKIS